MIAALFSRVWGYIAGAGLLLAVVLGIYRKGRGDEKAREEAEEANEYVETRKRMDAVDAPRDPDAVLERLRQRAKRPGNL